MSALPSERSIGEGESFPSVTGLRLCLWCRSSLEGKRPQARYCGESCRVMFTRAGKRGRLSSAERSRCLDCQAFGRSCSKHATKPAKGRADTTYPLPLFNPGRTFVRLRSSTTGEVIEGMG